MILTGLARLGRDSVLRFIPDGTPVLNLALAYSYGQKDKDGERPAQWIDVALWGKRAEALAPHLLKGVAIDVVVEDVRIESFERKDGSQGSKLAGRLISVEFAGAAKPVAAAAAAPTPRAAPPLVPVTGAPVGAAFDEDDIPF